MAEPLAPPSAAPDSRSTRAEQAIGSTEDNIQAAVLGTDHRMSKKLSTELTVRRERGTCQTCSLEFLLFARRRPSLPSRHPSRRLPLHSRSSNRCSLAGRPHRRTENFRRLPPSCPDRQSQQPGRRQRSIRLLPLTAFRLLRDPLRPLPDGRRRQPWLERCAARGAASCVHSDVRRASMPAAGVRHDIRRRRPRGLGRRSRV